jgi:hypothetical protein
MRIVGTSSNKVSQESAFYSNTNRGRGRGGKIHFEVVMEVCMVDIINMKVNFMEVDEKTLKEEEVVEVMVEVIEVNNQIMTQTATTAGNLGTWKKLLSKGA